MEQQKQYENSTSYDDIYAFSLLNSSVVQNNKFRLDKDLNL